MSELPLITPLRSQLESVLLVIDSPASAQTLARALDVEELLITNALREWSAELDARGSGIDVRETPEGWRLYTRQENAGVVEKLLLGGAQAKLSRAALETLAVVAYRQPVTRAKVAGIRGVNVDGVMRTLQLRGLIREVDIDPSTGAHLYETTELFLEQLGIDSLSYLPDLAPLLPNLDAIDELGEELG